ncbi:UDP-glucose 4-epimerase GalE [Mesorhizobium sp. IMUNJ 23232]|uniref:UDP-glucose 4-epimerase GalE n=1 Tax=Mesorhizobium sp. IMUNJ 23232 TaxID=3376064 RepID=UPI00378FC428
MTVLISGGAGYIGSHMVLSMLDKSEQTVVLDDLSTGFRSAVPAEIPFYDGDVADSELVAKIIRHHDITEIAHFAARTVVPDSVRMPLGYYEANTVKTRSLIETAVLHGVKRFIFSSTAAVYGEPDVIEVDEDVAPAPINPYGRSKLMSEWMLGDAAAATGLRYAILRYFNVAGADPQMRAGQSTEQATHLIKVACQAALGLRPSITVFGTDLPTPDGTGVRDYIQVSDLADAHVCALSYLRETGANLLLNCGYGRGYSVLEVLDAVKRVSGVDFPVIFGSRRPGDPAALIAKADRIRSHLDWRPRFDTLKDIVSQALAWERYEALRRHPASSSHEAASSASTRQPN